MHIAYLDEFGHIGPYLARDDPRHKTHPVFGLGGFVLPADRVREFGSFFQNLKIRLLAWELAQSGEHPSRWEKKGAALLTTQNIQKYPEVRKAMNRIFNRLEELDGKVFFYGQVKPVGTAEATGETPRRRYDHTMIQSIIRTGHALPRGSHMMMILDEVDDKSRLDALGSAAGFMFSARKGGERLIEPPMQVESHLYPAVQAADWICALLGRLSAYRLSEEWDDFAWADRYFGDRIAKIATRNSKVYDPTNSANCMTPAILRNA